MSEVLTVSDIECKIQERMEQLESQGKVIRLDELAKLMAWLINDDDY